MNRTIGSVPSAGGCRRASSRASWMLVPPRAVIASRNSVASFDRRSRLADRPVGERLDALVVEDDVERLAVVEAGEDLERGLADLGELLAAHAAGAVDDERDLAAEASPDRACRRAAASRPGAGSSRRRPWDRGRRTARPRRPPRSRRNDSRNGPGSVPAPCGQLDGRDGRLRAERSAAGGSANRPRRSACPT